jgi:hypothetical protein
MTVPFKKVALGALTALTVGLSIATPASAQYYYRGGGWGGGWGGPGPAVAAGVLGGMAVGAAAAGAANGPYYGPGPGYGGQCWIERRPIVDEYGVVIGRRRVRVCN